MPDTKPVSVKKLSLDLENFRTVKQKSELAAVVAIIATSPDRYWALTESLLDDGYLPTENIIVLGAGENDKLLTVRDGNRRIAVLKMLHGLLPPKKLSIPEYLQQRMKDISTAWRSENAEVPCAIYKASEAATVDRIVRLAHGKGEKAARDQWNAVARARHNRDANQAKEPALDLLEKYLKHGKNITTDQKGRWAGDYPLSVLDEAMKRLVSRIGVTASTGIVAAYPNIAHRDPLEAMLLEIGQKELGFDVIRARDVDFAVGFGFPAASPTGKSRTTASATSAGGSAAGSTSKSTSSSKVKAVSTSDPKAVQRQLKAFVPRGKNREKVVELKIEASRLDVGKTPLAFSFVLRSMFEISAKAYCDDHAASGGPSPKKKDGSDRPLLEVLQEVRKHLTKNDSDKPMTKALHGAITELGKSESLFSVTSLNQLVHNPKFSIAPGDVAIRFGNVFPLLEAMNR